jgi:3'-phosphoadenosine 5'-phosphosulfate sulfotransferase (PAPS reductase)/FAD synthetase
MLKTSDVCIWAGCSVFPDEAIPMIETISSLLIVAYSGGADSTALLPMALEAAPAQYKLFGCFKK